MEQRDAATQSEPVRCPKCNLWCPPKAEACDCGYNFATGVMPPQASAALAGHWVSAHGKWLVLAGIAIAFARLPQCVRSGVTSADVIYVGIQLLLPLSAIYLLRIASKRK